MRRGSSAIYDPVTWVGIFGIMLAVGIEVSIASFLLDLLQNPSILNISMEQASFLSSIFWFLFVAGRLAGSFLLKKSSPFHLLSLLSCLGFFLGLGIIYFDGAIVGGMALSLGVTTSLLFPIIFSLTIEQSCCSSKQVSGLLCMGNIGGAIAPMIQGFFADRLGVQESVRYPYTAIFHSIILLFS